MCNIKTISELPGHPDPVVLEPALGRFHEIFEELANQYGRLFTVQFANQPLVVINDAKLIKSVLCKRPEMFGPYCRHSSILEAIKSAGIVASDDDDWKQQRGVITASMESSCLARYFEVTKVFTETLKNRWIAYGENLSKTDLETEIFGFSVSVFTAVMFGDMGELPENERKAARNRLHGVIVTMGRRIDALLPQMHLERFLGDNDFEEEMKKIFGIIENLIAHNRNLLNDNNRSDKPVNMLQILIEIVEENDLDIRNIKLIENILQILLASESTTTNTLLRVLHCIADNPHVQKEIQGEVDSLLGKCGVIEDIKDIKKLKCIDVVIYETMRVSSVSRLVIVEAKADVLLDDVEIPCGTPLVLLIAHCLLDEDNFHRATAFDYRRWCGEKKKESAQRNNKVSFAFGAGPRSCPGRGLAMLFIKTVLAMICGNFNIRLASRRAVSDEMDSKYKPSSLGFTIEIRD